ncbi:hypothetical protein L6452_01845 [Arctium lappa]|uniref:Uncharacterized protein n=1 Tax=Arctium lappa TaxID=4217 RepID=A0ACB9FHW8_ARCLA|nr:hypothetical protein L6452_01845 [Arctium lappa]
MRCIIIILNLSTSSSSSSSSSLSQMASTEIEEQSQTLESKKRWVLRVSIHCEGCKRKVKKLLQSLPGVDDIEIETKLQRVVVTGDVSPESLIRKLVKAGKHAELWPETPPEKPPTISHGKEIKSPATETEIPVAVPSSSTVSGKVDEGKSEKVTGGDGDGKVAVEGTVVEEKKPETGSAGNQAAASEPVVEKKEEQTDQSSGGGGEGRKKKKKKPQNSSNKNGIGETSSTSAPPPATLPSNQSPPGHHGYQYPPPHYYTPPPPPVYTVSYNTAHPPVNSYYATPPPQSYAYSHYPSEMEPHHHQPSDFDSSTQPPLDSFEMFSDENPNGCLVM